VILLEKSISEHYPEDWSKSFMAVQPRKASAILLLRKVADDQPVEVFMVRRVIQSDFMPDVYVFPGGSMNADDLTSEQTVDICKEVTSGPFDPDGRTTLGLGVRAAAIRELFEEAGVLLAYQDTQMLVIDEENRTRFAAYRQAFNERKGSLVEMARAEHLILATERLNYFAHWITPEGLPKRFDTHFFLTTVPEGQQASYDQLETSEGIWIAPGEALARSERNEFPLVFATIHQLRELAAFVSLEEALTSTSSSYVQTHQPVLVAREDGQSQVHLPGQTEDRWTVPGHMTRPPE
jgi:8-oxo-dGTP pyrophosphatase MutT (NUDIX family)